MRLRLLRRRSNHYCIPAGVLVILAGIAKKKARFDNRAFFMVSVRQACFKSLLVKHPVNRQKAKKRRLFEKATPPNILSFFHQSVM